MWVDHVMKLWRLTGWEFYKIVSRKLTWILLLCVLVLPWSGLIWTGITGDSATKAEMTHITYDAHKGPPTAQQMRQATNDAILIAPYLGRVQAIAPSVQFKLDQDMAIINAGISAQQVAALVHDATVSYETSPPGSFDRKLAYMEVSMYKKLPPPGWGNTEASGLGFCVEFTDAMGFLFMSIVIILSITPVWPDDRASGVHRLLRCAPLGRRETVMAKIYAAALFALVTTAVYGLTNFCAGLATTGLAEWSSPLAGSSQFTLSPWNITLGSFFLLSLAWQGLGNVALALMTLLFSALSRSLLVGAGLVVLVYMAPLYVYYNWNLPDLNKWLRFDPAFAVRTVEMYAAFRVVDVLGQPVLLPTVMLVVLIIGCFILAGGAWATWMRAEPE